MMKKRWTSVTAHPECDICPAPESVSHLMLRCALASVIWDVLGLTDIASNSLDLVRFVERAEQLWPAPGKFHFLFAASAVTAWHARNDMIFNSKRWPSSYIKQYAKQLLHLWRNQNHKQDDNDAIDAWINLLV